MIFFFVLVEKNDKFFCKIDLNWSQSDDNLKKFLVIHICIFFSTTIKLLI